VELAVKEINDAGGVGGKPIELSEADDGAEPSVATASFDQLVESDKIDALLGPSTSPTTLAVVSKIKSAGVPTCTGSATSAQLSEVDAGGFFFRTAPPDRFQGPALAELILGDDHSKVAILARDDSYGDGLGGATAKALSDSGAEVGDVISYDPDGTNFESEVQKAADQEPDAVVLIGFSDDAAKVLKEMIAKGIGPKDVAVYTTDGFQSPEFASLVDPKDPSAVAGIKGTAPAAAPDGIDHPFMASFMPLGIPPIFSAYYYDCTMLMALATEAAGSDDPGKIAKAFAANLEGDTDCKTFADCKAALADGKTIHYRGASSTFDEWDDFEPGSGAYDVWSFDAQGAPQTDPPTSQIVIE
jgi:branched-chain amino acid transport system substrate-binding protein